MSRGEEKLHRLLQSQKIPHALLFTSPRGLDLPRIAYEFAGALLGASRFFSRGVETPQVPNHPDLHLYFPEGKVGMHPISSIRQLISDVAHVPYSAAWKLFILHEAERMLPTSSNALLKTFEEPSEQTVLILLSHHPERLLPTVLSRCHVIEFHTNSTQAQEKENETLSLLSTLLIHGYQKEIAEKLESLDPHNLFELVMLWYRERYLLTLPDSEPFLKFAWDRERVTQTPFIPLEHVEKSVAKAQLAFERSTKLSSCLEYLMLLLSSQKESFQVG